MVNVNADVNPDVSIGDAIGYLNDKLDALLERIEGVEQNLLDVSEKLVEVSDKQDQLREAVADLGLPGSGYSVFTADRDEVD